MRWLKRESGWKFEKASFVETTKFLNNPGRGWYQIYSFDVSQLIDFEELKWCICKEESLALIRMDIGAFSNQPLSMEALIQIESVLQFFDAQKKDMILRFTYDLEGNGLEKEPTLIQMIEQHMKQLGNLLLNYQDSIFILQGLFVGNWGEMHGSKFLTDEKLKQLADTLWRESGGNIYLAVRRPVQWRMLFQSEQNDAQARYTGLFNDGLFASETDLGTYGEMPNADWTMPWIRKDELKFTGDIAAHVPFGGEVVGAASYSDLTSAVSEMQELHVSYLNRIHDVQVLDKWKQRIWTTSDVYQGINGYEYVERHLGYRFVVRDVTLTKQKGGTLSILIENIGFANLYHKSDCQLILMQDEKEILRLQLEEDPRTWKSGAATNMQLHLDEIQNSLRTVRMNLDQLPSDADRIQPDSYQVYLQLRRIKDGRFIRFANEDAKDMVYLGLLCNLK